MLRKHAVRFIVAGRCRTYILNDLGTVSAICTALDMLEADIDGIESADGLAIIAKAWPHGATLADETCGQLIDTTIDGWNPHRAPETAAPAHEATTS